MTFGLKFIEPQTVIRFIRWLSSVSSLFNSVFYRINQLDEDEKSAHIKIINSMLTKKCMKDLLDGKAKF